MSVKRCKSAFTVWTAEGVPRVVAGGDLVDDDDPIYRGREHFFEDASEYVAARVEKAADVEDATAAPGERREVTAPRRGRPPKNRSGDGR
ncbi:hypothetical protein [Actinomadura sp. 9N215]|uniref:hypothetical protein n=1 Tax=Actinomadura sp. 9N215 TaxID=3375150 RepID=UPI0037B13A33